MVHFIYLRLQQCNKNITFIRKLYNLQNFELAENQKNALKVDKTIEILQEKLIYSDYIERKKQKHGFYYKKKTNEREIQINTEIENLQNLMNSKSYSVALKYIKNFDFGIDELEKKSEKMDKEWKPIYMPYKLTDQFQKTQLNDAMDATSEKQLPNLNDNFKKLYESYLNAKEINFPKKQIDQLRVKIFGNYNSTDELPNIPLNWMTDYEQYNDSEENKSYYGTFNQKIPVSVVPCGGCGALLHCQDVAIPGYLPYQLFIGLKDKDLKKTICQRCHFMKHYNTTIEVKVSAEEYPEILSQLQLNSKKALVLLMVDLTDFPCSIWPNLTQIIGKYTPIFVVGNKIDLLPQDCPQFIKNVEKSLSDTLETSGIPIKNIKHIALISSKTGYGIERLIHKLQTMWKYRGDVYMIGCTNVGKSTLFNALLQSDYCKIEATDLIQRATISPWPGTTLNLLKFPILNPVRWHLYMRMKRRQSEQLEEYTEIQLKKRQFYNTKDIRFATLQERIGRTFTKSTNEDYSFKKSENAEGTDKLDINENSASYKYCRWCYDTPGVMHSDQILHLLTTEELLLTLPKQVISPRTFIFKPDQTLFLAGLGRLDLLNGPQFIRITVFSSNDLPVTICHTTDADYIYSQLLLTEVFSVPVNNPKRLKIWPKLAGKEFKIIGISEDASAADVLLSSAGWISITPNKNDNVNVKVWTPEGRGIYLRTPALLAKSVTLRGARIKSKAAYQLGRQAYVKL